MTQAHTDPARSGNDTAKVARMADASGDPLLALVLKQLDDDQAQEVHQFIRSLVEKNFGDTLSDSIRILYGGSVKPDNIAGLMSMPDIDGALVGGASLDAESFSKIVKFKG